MKVSPARRHVARAALRDLHVLLSESKGSIVLFVSVFVLTSILVRLLYVFPDTGEHPSFGNALYAALASGMVQFSTSLINKRERGQKWQVAMAPTYSNHVVVCGVGKLGYRVILELVKFGREVVAVDVSAEGPFIEKVQDMVIPLVVGDARREETLVKAGVRKADSIIPCTSNELSNLDIALDARQMCPTIRVVMRMFDRIWRRESRRALASTRPSAHPPWPPRFSRPRPCASTHGTHSTWTTHFSTSARCRSSRHLDSRASPSSASRASWASRWSRTNAGATRRATPTRSSGSRRGTPSRWSRAWKSSSGSER